MTIGLSKYTFDADKTNQAIALLGGVTAQSYNAVGLHKSPSDIVLPLLDARSVLPMQGDRVTNSTSEQNSSFLDKPSLDVTSQESLSRVSSSANGDDALANLPTELFSQTFQNPEMLSRYIVSDVDAQGTSAAQQAGVSGVLGSEDVPEVLGLGSGFSLLDFIGQVVAPEEVQQEDLDSRFDGSRQAEVRDFLAGSGKELGENVRDFFQENVAGLGRDAFSDVVAVLGSDDLNAVTDPLLSVDYYSNSAELTNGLTEYVVQPIGAVSLVQVGPFYQELRQDVNAYFG